MTRAEVSATAQPASQEQRERALAMLREGLPNKAVAQEVGVSEATVRRWRAQAGLPPRGQGRRLPDRTAREPAAAPQRRERRVTASYYLPIGLVSALDRLAQERGRPVSQLVEELLLRGLPRG